MSTRSLIGIINADLTITAVYCNDDGYPSYNGRKLVDYWSDTKKLRSLLKLGALSHLGEILGKKHDFNWTMEDQFDYDRAREALDAMSDEERAKFNDNAFTYLAHLRRQDPRYRYTKAYKRDRGDRDVAAYEMTYWDEDYAEEYVYLWCETREVWLIGLWDDSGEREWRLLKDVRALTEDQQDDSNQGVAAALTEPVNLFPPNRDREMIEAAQAAMAMF